MLRLVESVERTHDVLDYPPPLLPDRLGLPSESYVATLASDEVSTRRELYDVNVIDSELPEHESFGLMQCDDNSVIDCTNTCPPSEREENIMNDFNIDNCGLYASSSIMSTVRPITADSKSGVSFLIELLLHNYTSGITASPNHPKYHKS
ncbi:hypothetical protein BDZ97DRAFT_1797250 [Flammula alnicola]|nr:hypothetical protein BDZ97DRAFT_1797250 [Flammula alnicola]